MFSEKGADKTMITPGQARYLLAIEQMRDRHCSMSRLAEILDVSKPSVTNMITALAEKNWVSKGPPLKLTARGKALAAEITGKQTFLLRYYSKELELTGDEIADDILILILTASEKFVDRLIVKIEKDSAKAELQKHSHKDYLTNFQGILPDGIYKVPFNLLKKNGGKLSMGDKGFARPGKLVITGGYGVISLQALPVTHTSLRGNVLKGRLARLFYWNGEEFAEATEQDGVYTFPVMELHWSRDEEKNTDLGLVQIKVHASVGPFNMPDSVADLAIHLDEKYFLRGG